MRSSPTQLHPRRSPSRRAQQRHSQRGIALIEALVSILILSIGVIGLMGVEATAINFSADAEDRDRASVLANEIASSLWLANSVTVTGAQLTAWQTMAADVTHFGLPGGNVTVTPTAGTARSTDIAITWKEHTDAAGSQNRQFTTRVILP